MGLKFNINFLQIVQSDKLISPKFLIFFCLLNPAGFSPILKCWGKTSTGLENIIPFFHHDGIYILVIIIYVLFPYVYIYVF